MGLFSGIKDAYKKTAAAVVIQHLLEHQGRIGFFEGDPATLSRRLVSSTWDQKPDMFGGKFGQRPHKLSVAAISLAIGVAGFSKHDRNRAVLLLALGNILSELEVNGRLYPLNGVDYTLIEGAAKIFADPKEQYERGA